MPKHSRHVSPIRRIAEADSVAVIGLGRFGRSLALELMKTGTEVLGVDRNRSIIQSISTELTQAVQADSTRMETLRELSIGAFDRVVLAIGSDVKASVLTASLLLQLEVPVIWAKADDGQHADILERLGVNRVLQPERDMGRRVAHLVRGAAADYIEIEPGYSMIRTEIPAAFDGLPFELADIREDHKIIVAAYRGPAGEWHNIQGDTILHEGDPVLIVGPTRRVEAFAQLR